MSQLGIGRRQSSGFRIGIVGGLAALVLLAVVGLELSHRVLATLSSKDALDVNSITAVLEYGGLPRTFAYGGLSWEAVEARRFGGTLPLVRIGHAVEGHPIYYEQGTPTDPFRTLYIPAAETGPHANLFIRYNPASAL